MPIFSKIITKVFGNKSDKDLKALEPLVQQINDKYNTLIDLNDSDLKDNFNDIKRNLLGIITNLIRVGKHFVCQISCLYVPFYFPTSISSSIPFYRPF